MDIYFALSVDELYVSSTIFLTHPSLMPMAVLSMLQGCHDKMLMTDELSMKRGSISGSMAAKKCVAIVCF